MTIPLAATSLLGGALERYCIMIGAVRGQDGVGLPGWLGSMDLVVLQRCPHAMLHIDCRYRTVCRCRNLEPKIEHP